MQREAARHCLDSLGENGRHPVIGHQGQDEENHVRVLVVVDDLRLQESEHAAWRKRRENATITRETDSSGLEPKWLRTQKSLIFGVWTAPGTQEHTPKGGGLRASPFGGVSSAAGAAQTQQIYDFRPAQNPALKNPSVCGLPPNWVHEGNMA